MANPLLNNAATLAAGVASGRAAAAVQRAKTAAIVYGITAALALVAIVFLLFAGYLALAQRLGPLPAALWIGGGFAVAALLVVGIYKAMAARREVKMKEETNELAGLAAVAGVTLLPALLTNKGTRSMLLLGAVGYIGYRIYRENERKSPISK